MNKDVRDRILIPAAIPMTAILFIGALIFAFSRILLAVTPEAAVGVGLLMALAILLVAAFVANAGRFYRSQRAGLIAAALALVAGGSLVGATLGVRPIEPHEGPADVVLVAKNLTWDKKEIELKAGKNVVVRVENEDEGVPHNFSMYRTPDAKEVLFNGDPNNPQLTFVGIASKDYRFPAPAAGTYFFRCDLHPVQMTGNVKITGEGGAAAPTGAPAPSQPGAAGSPTPTGAPGSVPEVSIAADNIAFDRRELALPAGVPVVIVFDNQEADIPHNVAIYRDSSARETLFKGEIFPGPATRRYAVDPIEAGTYFFRCDVHFDVMTGTVVVR